MSEERMLSTPEVCRLTGLSFRRVDYYTRTGLIAAERTRKFDGPGSYRRYSAEEVRLLQRIKRLLDMGFALQAIRRLGPDELVRRARAALVSGEDAAPAAPVVVLRCSCGWPTGQAEAT